MNAKVKKYLSKENLNYISDYLVIPMSKLGIIREVFELFKDMEIKNNFCSKKLFIFYE